MQNSESRGNRKPPNAESRPPIADQIHPIAIAAVTNAIER
jgi:hypothetical protein